VTIEYSVNGLPTCKAAEGGCGCIHAEQRLIIKLLKNRVAGDLTMLTTLEPCESCANLIVESNLFSTVYFLRDYRSMVGRTILESAGIKAIQL
jgi:deoxycytidylate deaminase